MRKNRIIYIILLIGCIAFSMAYRSRLSAVLLVTVASYPLAALALTALSLPFIGVEFSSGQTECEKNKRFEIGICVRNGFILPLVPLELICTLPDADIGTMARKRIYASLCPFGKSRLVVNCMHRYRGCYTCEIERAAICDPLRLIKLSRRIENTMTVAFLPRRINLGEMSDTAGAENDTVNNLMRGEKDEFSHVREYIAGDIMQLIHWKLTAKTNELMIKQFDEINDNHALILCDYNFPDGSDPLARSDIIIETAVAFAMSAAETGIKARVRFGSADADIYGNINGTSDFERFYKAMTVIPAKMNVTAFTDLICSCDLSNVTALFLITSVLTEEVCAYADDAAERYDIPVILACANFGGKDIPRTHRSFILMNIRPDDPNGIINAAASLEMPQ